MDVVEYLRKQFSEVGEVVRSVALYSRIDEACRSKVFSVNTLSSLLHSGLDGTERMIVQQYAASRRSVMRSTLMHQQEMLVGDELASAVRYYLLLQLMASHTSKLVGPLPKVHHWLPVCYLRAFSNASSSKNRRSITVNRVFFDAQGIERGRNLVSHIEFAHPANDEGSGYYAPYTEKFFGKVEADYASAMSMIQRGEANAWVQVVLMAFFAVQSARNPDRRIKKFQPKFYRNHREDLLRNVFAAMDELLEDARTMLVQDLKGVKFSPFFPPRAFVSASGTRSLFFPLSSTTGMLISDGALDNDQARSVAQSCIRNMEKYAGRTQQVLYGL